MKSCVVYIDDMIIFSRTFEKHLDNLEKVFKKLREYQLILAPEKCHFFRTKVEFLGHVVSAKGIETDPAKIDKIKNWPTPSSPEGLRSFLAFAGYYRKFVKDFSRIPRPLSELLSPSTRKNW